MKDGTKPHKKGESSGRILVVDDDDKSRNLLVDLLDVKGYEVVEAGDGEEALERAEAGDFDTVLLDVMMPGTNGIQVCRRLRESRVTGMTPILMVTGLQDRKYRLAGIEAGANDFLSKPVDNQELLLRVRNAVHCKHLQDQTSQSLQSLRELEEFRDQLVHMCAHDLRSPLMVVDMGITLMLQDSDEGRVEEVPSQLTHMQAEVHRLIQMVSSMLDISKIEHDQLMLSLAQGSLRELAESVIGRLTPLYRERQVQVEPGEESADTVFDHELMERVLINLLCNAIKHTESTGCIRVRIGRFQDDLRVEIADDGKGIPSHKLHGLFEKFSQVEDSRKRHSSGLGLNFCRMAVTAHGGQIGVDSKEGEGSRFWFSLPVHRIGTAPLNARIAKQHAST
jgi:signal transduction histidine kinase